MQEAAVLVLLSIQVTESQFANRWIAGENNVLADYAYDL